MIDEKKLIEDLEQYAHLLAGDSVDTIKVIIKIAGEQPKVGEWIPCSERVPEESGTYIVNAIENHIVHVTFAKWMPRMKKWNLTGSRSYWKVTAWMPLPEPYNPGMIRKQTNADRIRAMTDEDLAINMMCQNENGLAEIDCDKCDNCNCYECLLMWLQSEVEE